MRRIIVRNAVIAADSETVGFAMTVAVLFFFFRLLWYSWWSLAISFQIAVSVPSQQNLGFHFHCSSGLRKKHILKDGSLLDNIFFE